jgi:hypothetical protein
MYGLEDKDKRERFSFDLEKKIKKDSKTKKEMMEKAEKRIAELKKFLREGAKEKDFDQFGILLHGYTALQKIYKKIAK